MVNLFPLTAQALPYPGSFLTPPPSTGYPQQRNYTAFSYPYTTMPTYPNYYSPSWMSQTQAVKPVEKPKPAVPWQNQLKSLFHDRESIMYALHIRTFGATDKNHDGIIDPELGESGTFISAIPRLKELKALGVNTIHLLPILPVGESDRLGDPGSPGSVYAPGAYDKINDEYRDRRIKLSAVQQARLFVRACHKYGIHVMVDVPSCASVDLANERPELMAKDVNGKPLTPTNWVDIRMFVKDSPALREYYERFFDLMGNKIGVDGFRCDIARARTIDFWKHFINKYPDKAWLAETYTEEDASPMKNIPRDRPEMLLDAGFDSIYGQYHIFHNMDANQYQRYVIENQAMLNRVGQKKSIIGSFLTHDDPSTMEQGGVLYNKLIAGLMCVQPDTNPYILDGFTTGYAGHFDIFNWRPRPRGNHPDIGRFLQRMIELRQSHEYGSILTKGAYIPLHVSQDAHDPKIIAFLRQQGNKTLLIVANKDVNAPHKGVVRVPKLDMYQKLRNLAPSYGETSTFQVNPDHLDIKYIGPGRFYVFDINSPNFTTLRRDRQLSGYYAPSRN